MLLHLDNYHDTIDVPCCCTALVDWLCSVLGQKLLPDGCEVPTSFESVGHIAHLNLREELLPYKYIIGQVLLDKNPPLRTVVNKVFGSIIFVLLN
jgi:tRNA G37 N-methylase Trm5